MSKVDAYRQTLAGLTEWDEYLLSGSNLPGPRGNLELAQAAALQGEEAQFLAWLSWTSRSCSRKYATVLPGFLRYLGIGTVDRRRKQTVHPYAAKTSR